MREMCRYRVHFSDGTPPRDVNAYTEEGAKRTARYAERVTGNKARRLVPSTAHKLFAVGWKAQAELLEEDAST